MKNNRFDSISDDKRKLTRMLINASPIALSVSSAIMKGAASVDTSSNADINKLATNGDSLSGFFVEGAKIVLKQISSGQYAMNPLMSQELCYLDSTPGFQLQDMYNYMDVISSNAAAEATKLMTNYSAFFSNNYIVGSLAIGAMTYYTAFKKGQELHRESVGNMSYTSKNSWKTIKKSDFLDDDDKKSYDEKMEQYSDFTKAMAGTEGFLDYVSHAKMHGSDTYNKVRKIVETVVVKKSDSELTSFIISDELTKVKFNDIGYAIENSEKSLLEADIKRAREKGEKEEVEAKELLLSLSKKFKASCNEIYGVEISKPENVRWETPLTPDEYKTLSNEEKIEYDIERSKIARYEIAELTNPMVLKELRSRGYDTKSLINMYFQTVSKQYAHEDIRKKHFRHEREVLNETLQEVGSKAMLKEISSGLASAASEYYKIEAIEKGKSIMSPANQKKLTKIKERLEYYTRITGAASTQPQYQVIELIADGFLSDINNRSDRKHKFGEKVIPGKNSPSKVEKILSNPKNVFDMVIAPKLISMKENNKKDVIKEDVNIKYDDDHWLYLSESLNRRLGTYIQESVDLRDRNKGVLNVSQIVDENTKRTIKSYDDEVKREARLSAIKSTTVLFGLVMAASPALHDINIVGGAMDSLGLLSNFAASAIQGDFLNKELEALKQISLTGGGALAFTASAVAFTAITFVNTIYGKYLDLKDVFKEKGINAQKDKTWSIVKKYVESSEYDNVAQKNRGFNKALRSKHSWIAKQADRVVKETLQYKDSDWLATDKKDIPGKIKLKMGQIVRGMYCPVHESILGDLGDSVISSKHIIKQIIEDDASELGIEVNKALNHYDPSGDVKSYFVENFNENMIFMGKNELMIEESFKSNLSLDGLIDPILNEANRFCKKIGAENKYLKSYDGIKEVIFKEADMMANLHIRSASFSRLMGESFENMVSLRDASKVKKEFEIKLSKIKDKNSQEYISTARYIRIATNELSAFAKKAEEYNEDLAVFQKGVVAFTQYGDEYNTLQKVATSFSKILHGKYNEVNKNISEFKKEFGVDFEKEDLRNPKKVMARIICPIHNNQGYHLNWQASEYSYAAIAANKNIRKHLTGISEDITQHIQRREQELAQESLPSGEDINREMIEEELNNWEQREGRRATRPTNINSNLNPASFADNRIYQYNELES